MAFLRGATQLPAHLVHHTGTIVRFTTSQLSMLPPADTQCTVLLPDGQSVQCLFHLHPANPYIRGHALVGWIKSWVDWNSPVNVVVQQVGAGNYVRLLAVVPASTPPERIVAHRKLVSAATKLALERSAARRRRLYVQWERNPDLRKYAIGAWGASCQVVGCSSAIGLPGHLHSALIDVHHFNHVAAGGVDSPLNICLLCASHHALIHRAAKSKLSSCDGQSALVQVNGVVLEIRRDVTALW